MCFFCLRFLFVCNRFVWLDGVGSSKQDLTIVANVFGVGGVMICICLV